MVTRGETMRIQGAGRNVKFDTLGWCLFYVTIFIGIVSVWFALRIDLFEGTRFLRFQFYAKSYHFLLEMASILVCLSVFLMAMYSYRYVPNTKLLVMGYTFFASGILDAVYLTGYTGFMLLPNPEDVSMRSGIFLIVSRLVCAMGLLAVCIMAENRKKRVKIIFWFLFEGFVLTFLIWIIAWNPWSILTRFWIESPIFSHILQGGTIVLLAAAMLVTFHNYRIRPDRLHILMAASFSLLMDSEILSLSIGPNSPYGDAVALFLKLIGLALLFDVFYIHGFRRPYELLTEAKDTLNQYVNVLDRQVEERTIELTRMNDHLLADVELARDVQRSMLPTLLPQGESVHFSIGYVPAEQLSGDFYNVFRIDANRFGVCIGDVAGHGVSAAMLTVFAFQGVQSLQEESRGSSVVMPSFVLKHLYESFNAANFQDEHYMLLIYGVYNMETGILSYASGGLNTTPIRVRPDGMLQMLESEGVAICKMGDYIKPQYHNRQILMFPGDKLVFYTDGLTEAKSATGEMYAVDRLSSILRRGARLDSDTLSGMILDDVRAFTGLDSPDDDITLLIMEATLPF